MSLTLQKLGINVEYICSKCDNAVWQEITKIYTAAKDYNLFEFSSSENKRNYKLVCWCTLLHTYIQAPRINCDGYPDADFNKFVDNN